MRVNKVSDEAVAYILAHLDDRPRRKVAEAAGVSVTTCYKIAHAHGAWNDNIYVRCGDDEAKEVARLYSDMAAKDVAFLLGMKKRRVHRIVEKFGILHSAEYIVRVKKDKRERFLKRKQEAEEKRVRRWKARRRLEEMRVWEGKPQETRFRFKKIPWRDYKAWWRLTRVYGYMSEGGAGDYTLWWDGDTHRINEDYYARKYGFRFVESEDPQPPSGGLCPPTDETPQPPSGGLSAEGGDTEEDWESEE